jgi:hypothetical protein
MINNSKSKFYLLLRFYADYKELSIDTEGVASTSPQCQCQCLCLLYVNADGYTNAKASVKFKLSQNVLGLRTGLMHFANGRSGAAYERNDSQRLQRVAQA